MDGGGEMNSLVGERGRKGVEGRRRRGRKRAEEGTADGGDKV